MASKKETKLSSDERKYYLRIRENITKPFTKKEKKFWDGISSRLGYDTYKELYREGYKLLIDPEIKRASLAVRKK